MNTKARCKRKEKYRAKLKILLDQQVKNQALMIKNIWKSGTIQMMIYL